MAKKNILGDKLLHLSESQVDELLMRYYQGEKCIALLKAFGIDATPSALKNHLPQHIDDAVICPNCGAQIITKYLRRDFSQAFQKREHCSDCAHVESITCKCEFCTQKRTEAQAVHELHVSNRIYDHCLSNYASIKIQSAGELSLRNAMTLLAIVRSCRHLSESTYGPITESPIPFTPEYGLGYELIMSLIEAKLIRISENTNQKYFLLDADQVVPILEQVNWEIQLENFDEIIFEIESIGLSGNLPNSWLLEMIQLRLDLALSESKAFYVHCLNDRNLPSEVGKSAEAMLLNILRDNSVSQCYQAIWNGALKAIDFKSRQAKSNVHAANYMVGACQRYVDNARVQGWDTKGFNRNTNVPRSMISFVLYDALLKIGERGFTEIYKK